MRHISGIYQRSHIRTIASSRGFGSRSAAWGPPCPVKKMRPAVVYDLKIFLPCWFTSTEVVYGVAEEKNRRHSGPRGRPQLPHSARLPGQSGSDLRQSGVVTTQLLLCLPEGVGDEIGRAS